MKKLLIKLASRFGFVPAAEVEEWRATARTYLRAWLDADAWRRKAERMAERAADERENDLLENDSFIEEAAARYFGVSRDALAAGSRIVDVAYAQEYAAVAVGKFSRWFDARAAEAGLPKLGYFERREAVDAVAKALEGRIGPGDLDRDLAIHGTGDFLHDARFGRIVKFGKVVDDMVSAMYAHGAEGRPLAALAKYVATPKRKTDILSAVEATVWGRLPKEAKDRLNRMAAADRGPEGWALATSIVGTAEHAG